MTQGYVTLYRALDECINHITNAKNDEELEQWLNAQKSIIREIENYVEAHETKIDLIQLKAYLENKYDNKFEYDEEESECEPFTRVNLVTNIFIYFVYLYICWGRGCHRLEHSRKIL